jgi:serine protease Do
MGLPSDQQGVLVQQVEQGSPAGEAGLRGSYKPVVVNGRQLLVGGDVITAMDGLAVNGVEDLQAQVQQAQPGQEVTLTLLRDGKQVEVPVTLGERPTPTPTP